MIWPDVCVSILAPLARGALRKTCQSLYATRQFQSSPLSQEGRYKTDTLSTWIGKLFQSSPLSQEGRYATALTSMMGHTAFQSSPLSQEGRYIRLLRVGARGAMFQSSPLSQEGRYDHHHDRHDHKLKFQSSPLSQEGRYEKDMAQQSVLTCFNPRPSRKRGATADYVAQTAQRLVSILAPLARGALPSSSTTRSTARIRFQSSPLSQEGRYAFFRQHCEEEPCFNPRPSRKRGATYDGENAYSPCLVSILAPLARGALPVSVLGVSASSTFQSSPLSQEGRYGNPPHQEHDHQSFNPRPSRKRGATV